MHYCQTCVFFPYPRPEYRPNTMDPHWQFEAGMRFLFPICCLWITPNHKLLTSINTISSVSRKPDEHAIFQSTESNTFLTVTPLMSRKSLELQFQPASWLPSDLPTCHKTHWCVKVGISFSPVIILEDIHPRSKLKWEIVHVRNQPWQVHDLESWVINRHVEWNYL